MEITGEEERGRRKGGREGVETRREGKTSSSVHVRERGTGVRTDIERETESENDTIETEREKNGETRNTDATETRATSQSPRILSLLCRVVT